MKFLFFNSSLYFSVSESWLALQCATAQLTEVLSKCREGNTIAGAEVGTRQNTRHTFTSTETAVTLNIHGNKFALTYSIIARKKQQKALFYAHNSHIPLKYGQLYFLFSFSLSLILLRRTL